MALAEVVTLYDTNCRDIPEMLRGLADSLEAGSEGTDALICVRLTENGGVELYGWGDCDNLKAIAILQLAMTSMTNATLGYD